jgi:hypothetical protein
MKILFLIIAILTTTYAGGQTTTYLDTLIDVGIEQYKSGKKIEALKTFEGIEKSAPDTSSTYGTVLRNLLYYYSQEINERKMLEYYDKIINSKLNDKDRKYGDLSEMYKNYRYNATMILAGFYANQKKFETALKYINVADEKIVYEETSLTSIISEKVKLSFWKKNLYLDLQKPDSAFYVLLKRAFEYDYKNMYKDWATLSASNSELNLSNTIIKADTSKAGLIKFKTELDNSFKNLTIKEVNGSRFISFKFRNLNYDIIVYQKMKSIREYKSYLEKSFFYNYLTSKIE